MSNAHIPSRAPAGSALLCACAVRGGLSGGRAPGVCRQRLDLLHAELATDKYGEARRLSGLIHASSGHREYYVTCQLFADNGTPISLPTQTKHTSFAKRVTWQEWVTLPIAYRDLPADAVRTPNPARPCATHRSLRRAHAV